MLNFVNYFVIIACVLIHVPAVTPSTMSINVDIQSVQEVTYVPQRMRVIEQESHVAVVLTIVSRQTDLLDITLNSTHPAVALIQHDVIPVLTNCPRHHNLTKSHHKNVTEYTSNDDTERCFYAEYNVVGKLPGRTSLYAAGTHSDGHVSRLIQLGHDPDTQFYPVSVIRGIRTIDVALKWTLLACLGLVTFILSFRVEWDDIKGAFLQPIAPAIANSCQFALNPLLAYGLGRTLHLDLPYRLALFGLSCSPPSGLSYVWAYLLGADSAMSIMTCIGGNIAAFGLFTAWMYTLGRTVTDNNPQVPFFEMGINVAVMTGACVLGYLVRQTTSVFRFYSMKIASGCCLVLVSLSLALNIFTQYHSFTLFADWQLIACSIFVPYLGAFIAAIVTWVCRQSWPRVKFVYIQLCLQNPTIAIAMFYICQPDTPETDITSLYVNLSSTLASLPLWLGLVVHVIRKGCAMEINEGEVDLVSGRSSISERIATPQSSLSSTEVRVNDASADKFRDTSHQINKNSLVLRISDLSSLEKGHYKYYDTVYIPEDDVSRRNSELSRNFAMHGVRSTDKPTLSTKSTTS